MASHTASELSLTGSKDEALQAILDALPKDAVIRDEDDGVGRFAGQRTVAVVGRGRNRLMLFEGTWGTLRPRFDQPQVDVVFEPVQDDDGVLVRLTAEPVEKPGSSAAIGDFLNRGLTVAVLVVAYYWVRSLPIDYGMVATIAVLGGIVWSVAAFLMPKKEDLGLEGLARRALEPLMDEDEDEDEDEEDDEDEDDES